MTGKFKATLNEITSKIEELVKEGNIKRIIIYDQNGNKYLEIPMVIGIIFTIAAPMVTVIAAAAGFASKFTVEIITKDQPNDSSVYEVISNED